MKLTNKKILFLHIIFLTIVLASLGWAYYRFGNVAIVNGRPISRLAYIKNMERIGGNQTLNQMIEIELILGDAKKRGVTIDQKTIDTEVATIEAQLKSQGQTLESALKTQGMTREQLDQQVKIQKLVRKLSDPKTEFSESEIKDFLTKNKDIFPKTASAEAVRKMAVEEMTSQELSKAIENWLAKLKKEAKIIYK